MSRKRFTDGAGFTRHCWECMHAKDWEKRSTGYWGTCELTDIRVGKYDSPNNLCSHLPSGCDYEMGGERMSEHICELTPIDSETWDTTIGEEIVRCRDCSLCVEKGYRLYCDRDAGGFPEVEPYGFCAWGERRDA